MKKYILVLCTGVLFSCTENDIAPIVNETCIHKVLQHYNMIPYAENIPYCVSLHQYSFDGNVYFSYDSCIEDRLVNPFDCNGAYFLTKDGKENGTLVDEKQNLFASQAKYVGVVGIKVH